MHRTEPARPWHETLTDSVRSLGEAALEFQQAHRAAELAAAGVMPARRQVHPGIVRPNRPSTAARHLRPRHIPHGRALTDILHRYCDLRDDLHQAYEEAALLYASGAVWALHAVQTGHAPAAVHVAVDEDGALAPGPLEVAGVDGYDHTTREQLAAAYLQLSQCQSARWIAEEFGAQPTVTEAEAAEERQAWGVAAGIADAAYAYGQLVERAAAQVIGQARHPRHEHHQAQVDVPVPVITDAPAHTTHTVYLDYVSLDTTDTDPEVHHGHGPF